MQCILPRCLLIYICFSENVCGGSEQFEGLDCEIEEAVDKHTSFDNRVIKSEECRETQIPDIEVDGAFKKNVEKSKSINC